MSKLDEFRKERAAWLEAFGLKRAMTQEPLLPPLSDEEMLSMPLDDLKEYAEVASGAALISTAMRAHMFYVARLVAAKAA